MARIHGRMSHKMCKWGCCPIGELEDKRMLKEEMELANEELLPISHDLEEDPNWDGAFDWDPEEDAKYATRVTFIPAPDDSDHPWYEEYAEQLAKECPDPECICKKDQDG